MHLTGSTPILRKDCNPSGSKQDPTLAKAYGHIVTIMQTRKADKEKIELIMKIFDETITTSALEAQYIEELEKENRMLSEANDKFIVKHEELINKIRDLANQIDILAKGNGLISKEKDQLKQDLEELIKEKQTFLKGQVLLANENTLLAEKIKGLINEKDELDKQKQFSRRLDDVEQEADQLLEKSEIHLTKQEELKQELDDIQIRNKQLDSKLDELEFQKNKEIDNNRFDEAGYVSTGLYFTLGVVASGGSAIPGLLMGGAVYGFFQAGKQYLKHRLENKIEEYVKEHPTASKKEVWDGICLKVKMENQALKDV